MQGKDKNKFTIMVIPHNEDSPLVFKLPLTLIQIIGVLLLGVIMLSIGFATKYVELVKSLDELDSLRQENIAKSAQIELLAQEAEILLEKFEELKKLEEKLRGYTDDETNAETNQLREYLFATNRGITTLDRANRSLVHINENIQQQKGSMESIISDIEEQNRLLNATPRGWPTSGRITSPFGNRRHPITGGRDFHTGIDIANSTGTPIYATAYGRVTVASYRGGWGNLVVIEHGYGYTTYYAHLSRIVVRPNQEVSRGQLIGYMGSTGSSTGPHLHYEVRVRGNPVNPRTYMNK
ncbi:M23 family metallopeptidase [Anaerobranca gottschalkii]|uniref:Peptidase family M23 n=1 Tax=Anaerobranca gottschalkii DSM 13577 TaxID=1120990 RepID=A0A1I0BT99_9FIRM|nr:M23 family metallopeptidase [Anaerobranca gottschalkii]SET10309.1 Peptidase family M23 [Anaerobranca gottschalkii DSM 13577]